MLAGIMLLSAAKGGDIGLQALRKDFECQLLALN